MVDSRGGPLRCAAPEGVVRMLEDQGLGTLAAYARREVNKSKVEKLAGVLRNGNGEGKTAAKGLAMIFVDPVYDEDVRREALKRLIYELPNGNGYSRSVFTALGLSGERIADLCENVSGASRPRMLHLISVTRSRRKVEGFINETMNSLQQLSTKAESVLGGVQASSQTDTQERSKLILNDAALAEIAKTHEDSAIRMAAVERIESVDALKDVAEYANDAQIGILALAKINGKDAIVYIAQFAKIESVRIAAFEKVGDDVDALVELMQYGKKDVKKRASEKLAAAF